MRVRNRIALLPSLTSKLVTPRMSRGMMGLSLLEVKPDLGFSTKAQGPMNTSPSIGQETKMRHEMNESCAPTMEELML
jgi:hypothetical protein